MLVGNFEWVHLRKLVSELGHTPVWAQFRNFAVGFADKIVWAPVYTPVWELSYTLVAQRVDSLPVARLCKPVVVLESTLGLESKNIDKEIDHKGLKNIFFKILKQHISASNSAGAVTKGQ